MGLAELDPPAELRLALVEQLAEGPFFGGGEIAQRPLMAVFAGDLRPAFVKHCQLAAMNLNLSSMVLHLGRALTPCAPVFDALGGQRIARPTKNSKSGIVID
jgi:hypothetical protein